MTTFSLLYINAVLGLFSIVSVQWSYFYQLDGHGGKFTHPMRYKVWNGMIWGLTHTLLAMSLIVAGAGLGFCVDLDPAYGHDEAKESKYTMETFGYGTVRWFVCGGFAFAFLLMTVMATTYHSRDYDAEEPP